LLSGQPHARCRAQRQTGDMRLSDSRSLHESGHIVCQKLRGILAFRFVGFTSPPQVKREASEVLGIFGDLEGIAGVIGSQIRNENEGITGSWLLKIYCDFFG